MERLLHAFVTWSLEQRRLVGFFLAGWVLLALGGAFHLHLDFSSASFYGGDSTKVETWQRFQERWGADDRTLAVLVDRGGEPVLDRTVLDALEDTADLLSRDPQVQSVLTLGRLRPDPDGPSLNERLGRLDASSAGLLLPVALLDPRIVPLWVSRDGGTTVMFVNLATTSDDLLTTSQTLRRLREVLASAQARDGLRYEMAGIPAIRASFFSLTIRDQLVLVPLSIAVVGAGLFIALRSVPLLLVIGATVALPMLGLVGLMGWSGEPIGLLNQSYFTILPAILVADVLHLIIAVRAQVGRGTAWREAIVEATTQIGWACWLTTITTAVGFASLGLAGMPILRHFGLFAAATMLGAYAMLLVAAPWLLSTMQPPRSWCAHPPTTESGGWAARLGMFALRHPRGVLRVSGALALLAVCIAPQVVIDNRLADLLLPHHPVAMASERLDRELGGSLALEIEVFAEKGYWDSAAGQHFLSEWEAWARRQEEVRAVLSPRLDRAWISPSGVARVSLRVGDMGARSFESFSDRVERELGQRTEHTGLRGHLTGTADLAYSGVNRISHDLRLSLSSAFIVITLLIGALFRSRRWALVSMAPNVLPILVGYALLAPLGLALDPIAAVILAIVLGLAVDDTIHLLAAIRHGQGRALPFEAAVVDALDHSGRAVTTTSLVLALGLSVNLWSSFPPLRLLGGFGAALILLAWLGDVLLLPACLQRFWREPPPRKESEHAAVAPH